jgi:hypothetical protein
MKTNMISVISVRIRSVFIPRHDTRGERRGIKAGPWSVAETKSYQSPITCHTIAWLLIDPAV